jgi:hypothetical protein
LKSKPRNFQTDYLITRQSDVVNTLCPQNKGVVVLKETVTDFSDFVRYTEALDLIWEVNIFRGQAVEGNLVPSIARMDPTADTTEQEKSQLTQLRLMGASLLPDQAANDLDLLVLAQHFGLKTRLLDWTSNPLAALWFACADGRPGPAYVYALGADKLMDKDVYTKDPFNASETRVFQPRLNNARIIAQHGWFTLHRYSARSRKFVQLETNRKTKGRLTEILIPARSRADVLRSLDRHGISSRTLFPDLQGLCQHLNWKYLGA